MFSADLTEVAPISGRIYNEKTKQGLPCNLGVGAGYSFSEAAASNWPCN